MSTISDAGRSVLVVLDETGRLVVAVLSSLAVVGGRIVGVVWGRRRRSATSAGADTDAQQL